MFNQDTPWSYEEDAFVLKYHDSPSAILGEAVGRSGTAVLARKSKISKKEVRENLCNEQKFFIDRANTLRHDDSNLVKDLSLSEITSSKGSKAQKGSAYSHTRSGYRNDLDLNLRSRWEANLARVLNLYSIPFEFEPRVFTFPVKRGTKGYTPDFWLEETQEWIEVKGYLDNKSRIKLKRFAKYYPADFETLSLVISKYSKKNLQVAKDLGVPNVIFYENLQQSYKNRLSNWEG